MVPLLRRGPSAAGNAGRHPDGVLVLLVVVFVLFVVVLVLVVFIVVVLLFVLLLVVVLVLVVAAGFVVELAAGEPDAVGGFVRFDLANAESQPIERFPVGVPDEAAE